MRCLTLRMQRDREYQPRDPSQDISNKPSNLSLIKEVLQTMHEENDMDKPQIFFLNGYVSRIKNDERMFYPACPNDNCRRKVTQDAGGYRCENCSKTYSSYNPTYMLQAKVSDFSDSIYVNFSREQGTFIMGKDAKQFEQFKQSHDSQQVDDYLS
jgi:methionyl-tRNA synthetase